jgi:flagellar hook-length control protein FliK
LGKAEQTKANKSTPQAGKTEVKKPSGDAVKSADAPAPNDQEVVDAAPQETESAITAAQVTQSAMPDQIQAAATAQAPVQTAPVTDESKTPVVAVEDNDKADDALLDASATIVPAVPQDLVAVQATVVVPTQNQIVQDPAGDAGQKNELGTSILASINMGKSMDKASTAKGSATETSRVTVAPGSEQVSLSGTDTSQASATSPALAGKITQAAVDNSPVTPTVVNTVTAALANAQRSNEQAGSTADKFEVKAADSLPQADASTVTTASAASAPSTSAPAPAAASASLQTPVSNPQWTKDLGQQLVNFHLKGEQNVQLHLNPTNLGPMSITLNVNDQLQATAHFSSHSSQVRSALEQGIGQLREAMAQQGISLGEASVGEQRQQGFSQSGSGQQKSSDMNKLPNLKLVSAEVPAAITSQASAPGQISTYA